MRFKTTKKPERGSMELGETKFEFIVPGEATLSGLDIPVTKIGLMGVLFSITRDIVAECYGISICMTCPQRKASTDPYHFTFHIDYSLIEYTGEDKETYEKRCVKNFDNVMTLFKTELEAFVKDPEGLEKYLEYVATTDAKDINDDDIKEIRDNVMVKAGMRTEEQIKRKRQSRENKKKIAENLNKRIMTPPGKSLRK